MTKKNMKIVLVTLMLFVIYNTSAQNNYQHKKQSISITQDARLFALGDDKGNDPLTLNIMVNIELRGNVNGKNFFKGYGYVMPSFEYANLAGGTYRRYAINVGYAFTNYHIPQFLLIPKLPITTSVYGGVGSISRSFVNDSNGENSFFPSFNVGLDLSIHFSNNLSFVITSQFTNRTDLIMYWDHKPFFNINGFGGLKYNF